MISPVNLELLSERLRVYDVDQGAWEQEPNGFDANVRHVLTHLAKDVATKDFTDRALVRGSIASDSLQYALRLGRWAGVRTVEMTEITGREESIKDFIEENRGITPLPVGFAAFVGAMGVLAQNLHDTDHESTHDIAMRNTYNAVRSTSRLLVLSSTVQSEHYNFGLMPAFDERLAVLRNRFGIPEPEIA